MATYNYWALPMPVVASAGTTTTLSTMIDKSFGTTATIDGMWLAYYPSSQLATWNFNYWNPGTAAVSRWTINGSDIGGGFANQRYVTGAQEGTASLIAGNAIGPFAYAMIANSWSGATPVSYIEYAVTTVDAAVMSANAGLRAPTAAEVVATAYKFASHYGSPVNVNDCHFIAAAVAAASGATLSPQTQSLDPTQNQEGGFWRIAYRGSDPNPVANWQTLVKAGDIVRMGWSGGGQHTVLVLAVSGANITVYDNTVPSGGTTRIGIHTVDYDQLTNPGSVTIYRLTTDGRYLEKGTALSELLPGTIFNDHILGYAGNDRLLGAGGHDLLDGGAGADQLEGGVGNDTYVLAADTTDTIIDTAGVDTITSTITRSLASYSGIENLTLLGTANINATGDANANVLTGNAGNNILKGGSGADKLYGGAGNDIYDVGGDKSDTIVDSAGIDTINTGVTWSLVAYADIERLFLTGTANINGTGNNLNNNIIGNAGKNTLNGGIGNDSIQGNAGADILTGGAGADYFVYLKATDSNAAGYDTITDFKDNGADKIKLADVYAGTLTFLGVAGAFTGIGQVRIVQSGTDVNVAVNLDANNSTYEMLIRLTGTTTAQVTGGDFVL